MKIRLLTNLKVEETTTLPVGRVVDLPDQDAQELIDGGAALLEVDPPAPVAPPAQVPPAPPAAPGATVPDAAPAAAAAPEAAQAVAGVQDQVPAVLEEMTKAELISFAKDTLHVELNPSDRWEVLVANVKQLQGTSEA